MKRISVIRCLLVGLLFFSLPAFAQEPIQQKEKSAVTAAEEFLALVDRGQYQESWQAASGFFKSQVPEDQWVSQVSRLRPTFGQVITRSIRDIKYLTQAPGAPDGEYFLITFKTSFENKKKAVETVTPVLDHDGKWRIAGYFVR